MTLDGYKAEIWAVTVTGNQDEDRQVKWVADLPHGTWKPLEPIGLQCKDLSPAGEAFLRVMEFLANLSQKTHRPANARKRSGESFRGPTGAAQRG